MKEVLLKISGREFHFPLNIILVNISNAQGKCVYYTVCNSNYFDHYNDQI